jgi:hypothetical protein
MPPKELRIVGCGMRNCKSLPEAGLSWLRRIPVEFATESTATERRGYNRRCQRKYAVTASLCRGGPEQDRHTSDSLSAGVRRGYKDKNAGCH